MPADPCNGIILFLSVVHGSTELGIPVNISIEEPREDVVIRGPGKTGPSCRGLVATDLIALVDFLVKGFISNSAAAASLVFTGIDSLGNNVTLTLTNMLPRTKAFEMTRNNPPGVFRQRFAHQGDMDTDPLS